MSPQSATRDGQPEARILLIEDEPMLAFALEELLTQAGFEIAGVAGRLGPALAMIESGIFDAAILDANLAGVSAGPAASALTARGSPFIVLSGYSPEQQQGAFSGALHLQKPCRSEDLLLALRSILECR
jgi:DNA-binding response OmpR family regulator